MTKYYDIEIDYERDKLLTSYAVDMLMEFYSLPGEKSPQELYARAARAWSTYKGKIDYALAQRLYDYVSKRWFMFASPVLSNAPSMDGKVRGMPISCFLGYVPDTVPGLIDHSTELRWLSVMGGGVGGHWSDVRTVSELAPGPIPFIHTVDADMSAYKQGKTRKGSYAAYLNIDHPDILEFISIRVPTGDSNRKAFSIHNAVNITDKFMDAVRGNTKYELVDPKRGPTGEFLDARTVWHKLLEVRFRTGEPYLNFIDTVNRALPESQRKLGLKVRGSNLCNEIHLVTNAERTAVCCLSSPNLELYDEWKDSTMIADLLTMLDNVLEYFIENAPAALAKAVYSAVRERAIGLGGMGFHSYLQRLGVAYESDEALEIGEDIVREIRGQGLAISRILAAERGVPPDMAGTGLRWSHMFAWAPNASSSILVGTSPASEPWKANAFTQRTRAGSVLVKNKYLEAILERIGKNTPEVWSSIITNGGSVEHLDFLDDQTKAVFRTSFEIHQFWVVDHAAVRQPHICQGQSVNIFFKAGAQRKYVRETHERAYDKSLKGLYYLRTESKQRAENVNKEVTTEKLVDDKKTIVYGKSNCPFCEQAKRILDSKGIAYEYVDITTTGKTAAEITGRPGVRTVPQIYLEGEYIGGFQELYKKLTEPDKTISDDECKACEG